MAQGLQNTSSVDARRFDRELNEDSKDFHLPPDSWTKARNAINNSVTGDLGKLGNEPSNLFCQRAPYAIIGVIHINADRWAIFSTNNANSEIGIFEEGICKYEKLVNDPCLAFNKKFLIKGVSRATSDCDFQLYWDDGKNPSRTLNISSIPWNQICKDENNVNIDTAPPEYVAVGCITCTDLPSLNCDEIRLSRFVTAPCFHIQRGAAGGTIPNGTFFAVIAYTISGQKITDYTMPTNQQALFDHDNVSGSLDIIIDTIDETYDEFELVVVTIINQQTVARKVGIYSTQQRLISLDIIDAAWPTVSLENILTVTPVYDKSDAMYSVNDYLLRVGPTSKTEINYQPLANQIITKWTSVEYPEDYYQQGGSNTSYMRDEIYPFFIRFIYKTGDKTPSFHIPGRPAILYSSAYAPLGPPIKEDAPFIGSDSLPGDALLFETYNTATQDGPTTSTVLDDGGIQIAEGYMGYWQSTEKYPDRNQVVWNANHPDHPWTAPNNPYPGTDVSQDYDLCGEFIRHHKFPDNALDFNNLNTNHFTGSSPNLGNKSAIRILGVKFENIRSPVDNLGNPIQDIVAYEILRGSRQGNRTILAKGIINNMGLYDIEDGITTRKGAYPNYPYNDRNPDVFLTKGETTYKACILGGLFGGGGEELIDTSSPVTVNDLYGTFSRKLFSFHSPETSFTKPFLSGKELKVYGELTGTAVGKFEYSEKHPKHKLVTNTAFIVAAIAGTGIAALSMNGKKTFKKALPKNTGQFLTGGAGAQANPGPGAWGFLNPLLFAPYAANAAAVTASEAALTLYSNASALLALGANLIGLEDPAYLAYASAIAITEQVPGMQSTDQDVTKEATGYSETNSVLRAITSLPTFSYFWAQGTDSVLDLIKALLTYQQFALKYNSHCFYSGFAVPPGAGERRREIKEQQYLRGEITDFSDSINGYKINNLYRSKTVALEIFNDLTYPGPDNTRQRASDISSLYSPSAFGTQRLVRPTEKSFNTTSACFYVAYKQRIKNQYGQIDGIVQVPVSVCQGKRKNLSSSSVLFNGDTYIARYTEKNTFFYFYDWLYDQLDGYEFDYLSRKMMPYPRYWMNSEEYQTNDFTSGLMGNIANVFAGPSGWTNVMPSGLYNLDGLVCNVANLSQTLSFGVKYAYFYLFNSGVRDFFVESEINVALRDWGELDTEKHYPILDEKALFDTSIIKSGNYFKYDQSLSISKNVAAFSRWAEAQARDYDPELAETCYDYYPNQLIYSLPANLENKRDQWKFFLANNYKIFLSRISCIKPVNKSGALILFDNESPVQFLGQDQLQTEAGTKLTIGDGGLFSQPLQNIINTDRPYEYGSCQDRLSVINTPAGVFWISQNQGKIFNFSGQLNEISNQDLKWWFASYLPYKLTEQFPTFELRDNPVIGIGCQAIYDNENAIVYFTKRDFIVRTNLPADTTVTYVSGDDFLVNGVLPIKLGNLTYFEDASWTISYDPKMKAWVSWHDWHPNLMIPGKNTFMTILNDNTDPTKTNGIWIHNERCDSYCNYYGINYPFEVEYMVHTAQNVNTLRSIEYLMEVYKYAPNCYDRFHNLDFNFNEAVIYTTEQCSGLLRLNLIPKNNAPQRLAYPVINIDSVDILYSKEEQKYRFNQFWDLTNNRGEFPLGSTYPPPTPNVGTYAQRMIWNTAANGYVRDLNPNNLNYSKNPLQRKKFRGYVTFVLLRRTFTPDTEGNKMLVMLTENKQLVSSR
jgi:hypothetical protein